MIVAVTGTPGVGKTSVAEHLAERLEYDLVRINDVAERDAVETTTDERRHVKEVDVPSLVREVETDVEEDAVIDGHLSHHVSADLTVVLRCHPDELEQRLGAKGWSEEKKLENIEAEVLDIILQEAVAERDRVIEVDTTGSDPEEVAAVIEEIVGEGEYERYKPGRITWPKEDVL